MNRRRFLRSILGTAAASAVAPSLVWPFRKIFLPSAEYWVPISLHEALREYLLYGVTYYRIHPHSRMLANIEVPKVAFEPLDETDRAVADAATKIINREMHQCSVQFVSRNGFLTAPSPLLASIPIGPPNTVARVLDFQD